MSYNSMLADFKAVLNRDDATDAQLAVFMGQAVSRIQRDLRLPSMERSQLITCNGPVNMLVVPKDLVQLIDLIWVSGDAARAVEPKALEKLPYRDLIRKNDLVLPRWYARSQTQYWIKGSAVEGEQFQLIYYGNFSNWASGDSDNELSASTPDLAVYAALSYAGDFFECDQTAQWEARYQAIKAEVQQMATDLDAEGGPQVIQPLYRWE
jgi:hypothetical protein